MTLGSRAAKIVAVFCLSVVIPDAVNQKSMVVNHDSILELAICGRGRRAYTTETLAAAGHASWDRRGSLAISEAATVDGAPLSFKSVIVYYAKFFRTTCIRMR